MFGITFHFNGDFAILTEKDKKGIAVYQKNYGTS